MTSVVEQAYWDNHWDDQPPSYDESQVPFKDVFDKFLRPGGTCFEVGCYPGNFLIYLSRRFGYQVSGIDLTPHVDDRMIHHLARHGAKVGKILRGDFFTMSMEQKYDLVCSFGFIEHFANYGDVLLKHVELVAPGGTLFVSCPNFRGLQYCLHRLLDGPNLDIHVLKAMDLRPWRKTLESSAMLIEAAGYYRTAAFWADSKANRIQRVLRRWTTGVSNVADRHIQFPNWLTSPYMYVCATKP